MKDSSHHDLEVIRAICHVMAREHDVETLLNKVLAVLNREMGMLRGTFTILHDGTLTIEASHGLTETEKKLGHYRLGEGITGHVAETGRTHLVPDIRKDKRFLNRTKTRDAEKDVAFICVPIFHQGNVIGTLSIDREHSPDCDLERDAAVLEIIGSMTANMVGLCLRNQEERRQLQEENRKLRDLLTETPSDMIGKCDAMRKVYAQARQVAPSDATVLIRGSTGTGKELLARAIVKHSARADKPFIAVNCAALPEALIASELFGYEKGAFTGAVSRRIGRAETADGGTLFLDEVGDLSPQVQVQLLRFLQERTFSRVGSNEELHADVRFIAATSRNLEELMAKNLFREDLYYRLSVFPITMPDLSKRQSDIILLAEHFIAKMNTKYHKQIKRLSTPAINMLMAYHWPGNVRELENCIERAVLTSTDDSIQGYDLPPSLQTGKEVDNNLLPDDNAPLDVMVASYERELIVEALKRNNGNMSAVGRELGVSPRMMHYRVTKLGITPAWYARGKNANP